MNPVESYDPLLMLLVKSTSISVDEGGGDKLKKDFETCVPFRWWDKIFKCLWTGYGSRCQVHRFVSRTAMLLGFSRFPVCIKNGPPPKRHPANLTQLWKALDQHGPASLWNALTPCRLHALTNWACSEGKVRGVKLNISKVFLMFWTLSVYSQRLFKQ